MPSPPALTSRQQQLLSSWLPGFTVTADRSWGQTDMVVLELETSHGRVIAKAAGQGNGHVPREVRAHREWTAPWVRTGHASRLLHADLEALILVSEYLPGVLVEGSSAQRELDTFRQAGELLATFHSQESHGSENWNVSLRSRLDRLLGQPHRIDASLEAAVRDEVATWGPVTVSLVPTHGDWQPRNWLIDERGTVRIIDFGRADLRPLEEDFVRLGRQDFMGRPHLEDAFIEGYGSDPRDPAIWRRINLAEAVGTAVWAFKVGDTAFEQVGHRHLKRLFGG